MRRSPSACVKVALLFVLSTYLVPGILAQTLTFKRALELASSNGTNVGIAVADQVRARNAYLEARNAYVPAAAVGSGLGKSWGFPLSLEGSAPSVFNVNAQSVLFSPAQRSFLRAARNELNATGYNAEDQKNQAILDAAVTFAQLDAALTKLKTLTEQNDQAKRAEYITQQRLDQGLDSKLDLTRANLNAARTRMRLAEAQGSVDLLRQHLSQLTRIPAGEITLAADSMPAIPELAQDESVLNRAVANNLAVKMAEEHYRSKEQQARGEHNSLYPSLDFAAQYALLTKFNNYDEFYRKFERHNATIGVVLRFPFLNPTQRARAATASAEALRAKSELENARNQVASQILRLQRSLLQLAAARDVARLDWELSQGSLDAIVVKMQAGQANLRDQEYARIEVNDKYATYLDTSLEYDKARLQLMNLTGELRDWGMSGK